MNFRDKLKLGASAVVGYAAKIGLVEGVVVQRAYADIVHRRPNKWVTDPTTGLLVPDIDSYEEVFRERSWNVKTNSGIDFIHAQYLSTAPGANGLNYIALSNDTVTETATSTTLSNEITINGLGRAQGAYAHTAGTTTSTIDKTFTCATASQACQKAAVFSAASNGTMNHVLGFTQRTLQVGDTIQTTFTITIS